MTSTSVTDFRQNLSAFLDQAVTDHKVISVVMEKGNAVILNGDVYRDMMETLRLTAHPHTAREVLEGMREDWSTGEVYDPEEAW